MKQVLFFTLLVFSISVHAAGHTVKTIPNPKVEDRCAYVSKTLMVF